MLDQSTARGRGERGEKNEIEVSTVVDHEMNNRPTSSSGGQMMPSSSYQATVVHGIHARVVSCVTRRRGGIHTSHPPQP